MPYVLPPAPPQKPRKPAIRTRDVALWTFPLWWWCAWRGVLYYARNRLG